MLSWEKRIHSSSFSVSANFYLLRWFLEFRSGVLILSYKIPISYIKNNKKMCITKVD